MADDSRSRVGCWSLAIAVAAGLLLPLAAWPDSPNPIRSREVLDTAPIQSASPWNERAVAIVRDPFVPNFKYASVRPTSTPKDALTGTITVKAIALGRFPQALIEIGGGTRIVSLGDTIGTVRVRDISAKGVGLSNGSVLVLSL